jgi:hypothetical protein
MPALYRLINKSLLVVLFVSMLGMIVGIWGNHKAYAQTTAHTYYVALYGSAYGDGTSSSPYDFGTINDRARTPVRPGDTVIFKAGVYRVPANGPGVSLIPNPSATSAQDRTTFKAAKNARVIFTSDDDSPPKVYIGDYVSVKGLWFGGTPSETAKNCFCLGTDGVRSGFGQGKEIIDSTIFGYRDGASPGTAENLLFQGNRYVNSGRDDLHHAIYLTGGYSTDQKSQHMIVDRNIIIGSNGYGVKFGHYLHSSIITRNFIAGNTYGISLLGSQFLVANNFIWKSTGYQHIGAYLHGQGVKFFNNVLGPNAVIYYSHESNSLDSNAFLGVKPMGTNPILLTRGAEAAQIGLSEQEIDQTVSALKAAFLQPVDDIYNDQSLEPLFSKLRFVVPDGSPLFQSGVNIWSASGGPINVGPDSPAPSGTSGFWKAFRALGLRDFDRYGKVTGGDKIPPTVQITKPVYGAKVSGTVKISAVAVDNVEVAGVLFLVDGVKIGDEDTDAWYEASLKTTGLTNGSHLITALARDVLGNVTVSEPITINIEN